jgi:hypothetical protein
MKLVLKKKASFSALVAVFTYVLVCRFALGYVAFAPGLPDGLFSNQKSQFRQV